MEVMFALMVSVGITDKLNFVIYNLNVPIREKSQNGTFFFSKIEGLVKAHQSSLLPQGGSQQTYLPEENCNNCEPELL